MKLPTMVWRDPDSEGSPTLLGSVAEGGGGDQLRDELEAVLARHSGRARPVVELQCHESPYRSTSPIVEARVRLADGARMQLLVKDVGSGSGVRNEDGGKPGVLADPEREIEVYRNVLDRLGVGTPVFYGAVQDFSRGHHLLVLEKVSGVELFQVGDVRVWESAARWLARFHVTCEGSLPALQRSQLVSYDAGFYRRWISRAVEFARTSDRESEDDSGALAFLAGRYDGVVERLASQPATLVHGEFYPSNVLVRRRGSRGGICPVDWETAAFGPPLVDLAALSSGWAPKERRRLEAAYYRTLAHERRSLPDPRRFQEDLDYCRIHTAVQWLGWSRCWSPPAQHAHDWLAEALGAAERLGL
jgi:aminoglycoside phosphotransferase (APT) family kinase protein